MSAALREHMLALAAAHEAQAKAYDAYQLATAVEGYSDPKARADRLVSLAKLAADYRDMARSCADDAAALEVQS